MHLQLVLFEGLLTPTRGQPLLVLLASESFLLPPLNSRGCGLRMQADLCLFLTTLPAVCLQMMQDWLNHYKLDRKTLSAFAANAAAASNYEEWTLEQASRAVEDIVAKAGQGCWRRCGT